MTFEGAIEVFVRAIAFLRSWTHPCLAETVEGVWVMRDAERRRGDYRKEEWIAWHQEPAEVDRIARTHTRGRYFIGAFRTKDESDALLREAYRAMGYRLLFREGFFIRDLDGLSRNDFGPFPDRYRIERVKSVEMADRLAKAARSRQILPEHFTEPNPPVRQYVGLSGQSLAGWVRSVPTGPGSWVSNLFVEAAHRRQGLGGALMAKMLLDDAEAGLETSVLLASHAGAMLYPKLGYRKIGELLIYAPPKAPNETDDDRK